MQPLIQRGGSLAAEMADQRLNLPQQNLRPVVANAEPRLAEVKSRFFSAAAHELRTPLTTIVGYLEMLLDEEFGPLSESQREPLEMAHESASHLRAVTSNLLTAARIEAGRVVLEVQPVDLASLVRAVAVDFESLLEARAQRLELNAPPALPPALCDEKRVVHIIGNLLSCACEHTPAGELVCVSVARAAEEGFLQIAVADTGAGWGAEGVAEIARPLSGRESGAVEADVANLGLYVVCSLVELHGGRAWCESGAEGTSFCVTFPTASDSRRREWIAAQPPV